MAAGAGLAVGGETVAILNEASFARCYTMGATPRIQRASGEVEPYTTQRELKSAVKAELTHTAPPPANWKEPEFADSDWVRVKGFAGTSANLGELPVALICARSRFEVKDPAHVGDLEATLSFIGGAVVYLNGREIGRAFMPAGEIQPETPAEVYPPEAYLDPDGFLLRRGWGDPAKYPERFRNRVRTLKVKLPAAAIRKGVNVLAVEIHRALTSEVMFTAKVRAYEPFYANWGMCSLESVRSEGLDLRCGLTLTAPAGSSAVPNVARPAGFQVWSHPVMQRVHTSEYGDPNEPLTPVSMVGARNGAFSGQFVVGSSSAINGLRVGVSELKSAAGGTIPAARIQVRFASLAPEHGPGVFDGLHAEARTEIPLTDGGAVQPVWLTVAVPREARPGVYTGRATVTAAGVGPVEVPVSLRVADWEMPDSRQFATHVGLIQSPESVALRYDVPMWSDAHWKLIERSFELLGQVGTDTVYLPLLRRTHFGNEHSMVRWIRKPGAGANAYSHDFSIVDRYLDLAVKHLGRPSVVSLYCWEVYTGGAWAFGGKGDGAGKGMGFSLLDPQSGALEEAVGPEWGSPEIRDFWRPVLDGVMALLKKKGLEGSALVGLGGDTRPSKASVQDLAALLPGVKWELHTHPFVNRLHEQPVGYLASVWGAPAPPGPNEKRKYGWNQSFLFTAFPREGGCWTGPLEPGRPPLRYLLVMEGMLVGGGQGIGRVGADFWPVLKDGRGRLKDTVVGRYKDTGGGGSLSLHCSDAAFLAPGREGADSSVRFEMLRMGVQVAEARIALERALQDPAAAGKLGPKQGEAFQALLDERLEALKTGRFDGWPWFVGSGWQERDYRLYEAAGAVARAVGRPGGTP